MSITSRNGAGEWRCGWPIVLACAVGLSLGTVPFVTIGVFLLPIQAEFGWSRTTITFGASIAGLSIALISPFIGQIIDRIGTRPVVLTGAMIAPAAFASFSLVTSNLLGWWLLWGILSVGLACASPLVWAKAVASRFEVSRGSALAIMFCGSSIAQAIAVPGCMTLIEELGWRIAYVVSGILLFLFVFPPAWRFMFDAKDLRRRNQRTSAGIVVGAAKGPELEGLELRVALRTPVFWLLFAAVLVGSSVVLAGVVHFVPILVDVGVTPLTAASLAVAIPLATAVGKLTTGFLLDRFPPAVVAGPLFVLPAIAFLLLAFSGPPTTAIAVATAALLGVAAGAEVDLFAFLTARYFGLRAFGAIYGIVIAGYKIGMSVAPVGLSLVYDFTGNYHAGFFPMAALCVVTSLLLVTSSLVRKPRSQSMQISETTVAGAGGIGS